MDHREVAFVVWRGGRGCCGCLPDDLNLTALNNDPIDGVAHQRARLGPPPRRGAAGREIGSGQLPAQDLDHKPLDVVGIDTGEGTGIVPAVMQQCTADVVAIAVALTDRIGRGHDVAAVIINQAAEKGASLDPRLASCRAIVGQPGVDRIP
jgi:hypothetical protein